ncbi:MAG: GH32 C-terminal domain-containing protein [Planctomycetia bacterium]
MTIASSFKPCPTYCPRSIFTASDRRRTRGDEAPGTADWDTVCADARKTPPQGGVVLFGNRLRLAATSDLAAQEWSGSREIVAEVPLTGLSLPGDKALLLDLREADILHRESVAKIMTDRLKNHNYMPHQIADRLYQIPMEPDADGKASLRIFTDRSVLEVYTGDGKEVTAFLKFSDPEKIEAKAFANGGAATVESAAIWKMNPIQWSFTTADALKKDQ